jgi:hypothetical protein
MLLEGLKGLFGDTKYIGRISTMRSFLKRINMFYLDSMYCLQYYVFYDGSHFRCEFIHSLYEEEYSC